ncbi:hypothetical protein EUGRSUZ_G01062 [Eucalyptus grandis]|uniref:Uncharacterized protein n=2 Tax=Eucalyptus grandis TaxID=71139 RepID=A0ACC3K2S5_EUCGR|nr:hypothetical protein EUGRSUZ_G01062 [Eucalyptus grandis]
MIAKAKRKIRVDDSKPLLILQNIYRPKTWGNDMIGPDLSINAQYHPQLYLWFNEGNFANSTCSNAL